MQDDLLLLATSQQSTFNSNTGVITYLLKLTPSKVLLCTHVQDSYNNKHSTQ